MDLARRLRSLCTFTGRLAHGNANSTCGIRNVSGNGNNIGVGSSRIGVGSGRVGVKGTAARLLRTWERRNHNLGNELSYSLARAHLSHIATFGANSQQFPCERR